MKTLAEFALRLVAGIAMTGGLVAFADPALASPISIDRVQVPVATADLNLTTAAGQATAARRIRMAAAMACSPDADVGIAHRACLTSATREALRTLGQQALPSSK